MSRPELRLVEADLLPHLSRPAPSDAPSGPWPLLCFLHGYDEGSPMPIRQALTRHGPLAAGSAPVATARFLVLAPQLPAQGDCWYQYAGAVEALVRRVQADHTGDPRRAYLTGFSSGGNGVFDLALVQPDPWAVLGPVDPTRVPEADPGLPVWLSSGEVSRYRAGEHIRRLRLEPPTAAEPGERVYADQGQDHVGTARLAYQDGRIYRWLLSQERPGPGG